MASINRWRIEGTLTTLTALHIGDGGTTTRPGLKREVVEVGSDRSVMVEVSSVATDCNGRAYVPGSTLKGNLRSWLKRHAGPLSDRIEGVFGSEPEDTARKDAVGGKAEFHDAYVSGPRMAGSNIPHWNDKRQTGIAASVAIDRRSRTASPAKLFHEEYVPPGVSFGVVITGQDLDDRDVALILLGLRGFGAKDAQPAAEPMAQRVRLGGDTQNDWGRLAWGLAAEKVFHLAPTEATIKQWLDRESRPVGYCFKHDVLLPKDARDAIGAIVMQVSQAGCSSTQGNSRLVLTVELKFDGPFLVNEPSRAKPKNAPDTDPRANHAPRVDHEGRVVLPASSIRGAFRSQAERILRTLNPNAGGDPNRPQNGCDAIEVRSEVPTLSLAAQVFGAPGWASPITFSDYVLVSVPANATFGQLPVGAQRAQLPRQEFVAIDRFTGGGAPHLKFNAEFADRPRLIGTIGFALDRLEPWALGLLALTLRDLIEGDITFGFGPAKGYGACRVVKLTQSPPVAGTSASPLDFSILGPSTATSSTHPPAPDPAASEAAKTYLTNLVKDLRVAVKAPRFVCSPPTTDRETADVVS